jgi:hypothetical protein
MHERKLYLIPPDWIDRRFYRAKYDAEKTLAAFAGASRDVVDIPVISASQLSVVRETVQPEDVQLLLDLPEAHP